jgi:hypothetical protein
MPCQAYAQALYHLWGRMSVCSGAVAGCAVAKCGRIAKPCMPDAFLQTAVPYCKLSTSSKMCFGPELCSCCSRSWKSDCMPLQGFVCLFRGLRSCTCSVLQHKSQRSVLIGSKHGMHHLISVVCSGTLHSDAAALKQHGSCDVLVAATAAGSPAGYTGQLHTVTLEPGGSATCNPVEVGPGYASEPFRLLPVTCSPSA